MRYVQWRFHFAIENVFSVWKRKLLCPRHVGTPTHCNPGVRFWYVRLQSGVHLSAPESRRNRGVRVNMCDWNVGPTCRRGVVGVGSPLMFPSKSWSPFAYDMWDPAASPRGSRRTLTQAVWLIVVILWFIIKTLNYFQIKLGAFKCLNYWSSKIQQKMFVERLK